MIQVSTVNAIPTMTSNTTPSGVVSASSIDTTSRDSWKAFDKGGNVWKPLDNDKAWIAYEFPNNIAIAKYSIQVDTISAGIKSWRFEGWDGQSWIILDTQIGTVWSVNFEKKEFIIDNKIEFKKYRIFVTESASLNYPIFIREIEMFERIAVNKILISSGDEYLAVLPKTIGLDVVPTMTSLTNGKVVISSSSMQSASYSPDKLFNDVPVSGVNDRWLSLNGNTVGEWVQVDLGERRMVGSYNITAEDSTTTYAPIGFNLKGSNDGINWELLDSRSGLTKWGQKETRSFVNSVKVDYYRYYRITATEVVNASYVGFGEIELIELIEAIFIKIPSSTESNFINYGVNKPIELDLSAEMSTKSFMEQSPTTLGSGKVFKKSIVTSQFPIKKVSIN